MRTEKTFRSFLIFFSASLILLLLSTRGFTNPLQSALQTITVPVKTSLQGTRETLLSPFHFLSTAFEDGREIGKLRQEVASLSSQLAAIESLREENEQLRRLLGAPLPASWKYSPARVVGRSQDILLVLGQTIQGIPVIVPAGQPGFPAGILVGKTGRTYGRETEVILPTHPESKIPAGTANSSGLVLGKGGAAVLDQILTGESLEEGDLVLTSGESGFPPDLLIGEVADVASSQTWKTARLKTAFEPSDYTKSSSAYVFLITDW